MTDATGSNRATVDILGAPGGWPDPWPNVEELAGVLPSDKWTLIGGLMAQLHTVHYGPFGALVLKAAAFRTDSRNPDRHLYDAAALLACIEDPYEERDGFAGSDRPRILGIQKSLPDDHAAWLRLSADARRSGQAALRLLCQPL